MTDERDSLERAQSLTEKTTGKRLSPDEFVNVFAMYGNERRATALDAFDAEVTAPDIQPRRRAELFSLQRKLNDVHEVLRKAGR